jgi:3-hydroxyisobutyrate dehydrogenase-like beta-hydroxyacid dehydrogenase
MNSNKGKVGVIGLGIMGGAFARNLATAGWQVTGYDIDKSRCDDVSVAGIQIAADPADVAQSVPTIITSLPKPAALHDIAKDLASSKGKILRVVEASTFALEDKLTAERILSKAGHIALDCPVSGTGAQAKTKDLVIYASGDPASIKALRPLFADFSRATYDLGVFGNGSRMKYVANLLVSIHNVATAEAFVLGMKAGLDPRQIQEVISAGAGNSRIFELRGPMMVKNDYREATMRISTWQKDVQVINAFARELGCPTPTFDATLPIYEQALAEGRGDEDTASVCSTLETMAGFQRG